MAALYELYDSDNPLAIPVGVKAAGYDDGYAANAWAAYGWARFPDALHISIYGNPDSDVDDVESGGDVPSDTPNYAAGRKARGKVAIIYVNRSNGHLVEQYLRGAGFTQSEVMLWIGTDDGTQVVTHWIDGTPVYYPVWAVQYLNPSHGSGGHYDRSLVYLAFGGGGSTIGGDDDMPRFLRNMNTGEIAIWGESGKRHVTPDEWGLFGSQPPNGYGDTYRDINQIQWDAIPDVPTGGGGGTPEPPEPAEPKTITLDIPSVPGKATGTIS